MATSTLGRQAEATVAHLLEEQGFKVIERNWSTPLCEIDIIASKDQTAYLVEVKYRSQLAQGSGFEYIGPKKLKQMEFAAQIWAKNVNWPGDIILMAAEVTGTNFENISLVEITD